MRSFAQVLSRNLKPCLGLAAACAAGVAGATAVHADRGPEFDALVRKHKTASAAFIDDEKANAAELARRSDKQLLWQTLRQLESGVGRVAMWKWCDDAAADSNAGRARVGCVMELGEELNGHVNLIHGGFTATLIDDLLGSCAFLERDAQGLPKDARVFTANLNVNYRRPMHDKTSYYAEAETERFEKGKKIFMKAAIYDAEGAICADATSLYIVKLKAPAGKSVT